MTEVAISTKEETKQKSFKEALKDSLTEVGSTLKAIVKAPRALWGINLSYLLEGLVYFGILTVITKFLHENVKLTDVQAGFVVSLFTGGITIAMLFLGGVADRIGARKALLIATFLFFLGRLFLANSETFPLSTGLWSSMFFVVVFGLFLVVIGYGLYQPAAYAAVKELTTKKTAAMGYAMLYALMNLGAFFSGIISPIVRKNTASIFPPNGISGVFWVYVGFSFISFLSILFILTKRAMKQAKEQILKERLELGETTDEAEEEKNKRKEEQKQTHSKLSTKEKIKKWIREHPFRDGRFVFFIFILIPVQTLFAHNWLTLPLYINRAYPGFVGNNFEFFSNINPILIFVLTPLVAAITQKYKTYRMMIAGTFVMALPTFLLAIGPIPWLLITYIILMSVGEAMWQPRFLQYIAEIAPEGKTAQYMGIGQFPWFLTKVITGFYSGWFLAKFCPDLKPYQWAVRSALDGICSASGGEVCLNVKFFHTEILWLIYGLIAIISPVALWLAKGWIEKGKKSKLNN